MDPSTSAIQLPGGWSAGSYGSSTRRACRRSTGAQPPLKWTSQLSSVRDGSPGQVVGQVAMGVQLSGSERAMRA